MLRDQAAAAAARISRLADFAASTTAPRLFLEKIEEEEKRRAAAATELEELEQAGRSAELLRAIGPADVERMLAELASNLHAVDREALKAMVVGMVERIELDPETAEGRLHYRIDTGELMASRQ